MLSSFLSKIQVIACLLQILCLAQNTVAGLDCDISNPLNCTEQAVDKLKQCKPPKCDGTATKDPCADLFANETLKTSSVCTQLSAKVLPLTCSSPDDTGAADSDVTCTMGSADSVCSVLALLENRCTDMGCNHTAATCSSAVHLFAFTTISLGIIGVAAVIAVMI